MANFRWSSGRKKVRVKQTSFWLAYSFLRRCPSSAHFRRENGRHGWHMIGNRDDGRKLEG